MIEDSDSDADLFNSLPDTLEEFATPKDSKSNTAAKSSKKDKDLVVEIQDDDDDDFIVDEEDEEEEIVEKKPAKRTFKVKTPTETAKKSKASASVESVTEASTEEAIETPKKKFKYNSGFMV